MKTSYQKGFSIAAFFVAIAAFLGFGTHAAKNMQATTTVDVVAQTSSTSDWKTYTDTQHGFSIKYPGNYGFATELSDGVEFGQDGNAYMTIHFPKRTFTGSNLSFTDYMNQFNVKGYTHAQVNVGGIAAQSVTSSQIGTMVFVPLPDGLVLEIDGDNRDPSFTEALSTLKLSGEPTSYNSTNPNMSGGLNASAKPISNASANGTLSGKATITCPTGPNTRPCTPLDLTTLGILIRKPTSQVQADGSMAITVKDLKFNSDGTFTTDLPPGTYYLNEDDNDWTHSDAWTATFPSNFITINSGQTTNFNITISKIKTAYPI